MLTPAQVDEMQLQGLSQAMDAYDWRYTTKGEGPREGYELLLTGGKVIRIWVTAEGALKIEKAAESYGDNTLFLIAIAGTWS